MTQTRGEPAPSDQFAAAAQAGGGSVVVVAAIVPVGIVTAVLDEQTLGVSATVWRLLAFGAFVIAIAAVGLGLVRAAIAVRDVRRGGSPPYGRPRVETIGLLAVLATCGLIALYVFGTLVSSCDHLPDGSERTACAMGGGFLGILLVLLGGAIWLLGSFCFGATWVMRSWLDLDRDRRSRARRG